MEDCRIRTDSKAGIIRHENIFQFKLSLLNRKNSLYCRGELFQFLRADILQFLDVLLIQYIPALLSKSVLPLNCPFMVLYLELFFHSSSTLFCQLIICCLFFHLSGIYGVGKAAEHPPALAVLSHTPDGATQNIAWVGKGIVYDTGGLSIKGKVSSKPRTISRA